MIFNSLDEVRKYVEKAMQDSAIDTSARMLEIMREQIQQAYNNYSPSLYVRTMALMETPQLISANERGVEVYFADNGGWYSLVGATKGQHFFALEGLEAGATWGRKATDIFDSSDMRCRMEATRYYKDCLKAFGVPIK